MSTPTTTATPQKAAFLSAGERIQSGQEALSAFKSTLSNFISSAKEMCAKGAALVVGTILNAPNDIKAIGTGINNLYNAAKEQVQQHFERRRIERLERMETKLVQDISKKIISADILPETRKSLLQDLRAAVEQGHKAIEAAKLSGGRLTAEEAKALHTSVTQTLTAAKEQVTTVIAHAREEKLQSEYAEANAKRLADLKRQMQEIADARAAAERKRNEAAQSLANGFTRATKDLKEAS